jgi:hypothetical protein
MGLNKRTATYLQEMGNTIAGIDSPREIIRWAFYEGIEVGDVSPVFDIGGSYVVAILTTAREKGTTPIEQMKDNIKPFVLTEKKASVIKDRIKNINGDIYEIAREFNTKVDTNLNITFGSRNIPGFGSEYSVIGEIFSLSEGEQSGPIQGNGAVFVVILDHFYDPPRPDDFKVYRDQMAGSFRTRISGNPMFNALQKKTKIEDNRLLYF